MKKLNKLFAILFAVLGVTTLKAQTNIIADWDGGSNTGKPTTFGWASSNTGRSWGELNGGGARVTNTYSGYTKEDGSTYSYVADSEPSTQILWIRYSSTSETYTYTFSGLEAGKVYTFSGLVGWHNNSSAPTFTITVNGDKELAKVSKYVGSKQKLYPFSVDFYVPSDNTSESFTLKFNSNQGGDNMEALSALSIVESTDFANASESAPYDMTSWLSNPGFENVSGGAGSINTPSGWKIQHTLSGWLDGTGNTTNPSEGSKCYNIWAGGVTSIDMNQAVTLPAGKYKVLADLRTDGVDKITNQCVYAKVGDIVSKSGTIQTVASTWNSLEGWNTLETTFNNGSEGEVVIGISSTGTGSGSAGWFQADNVRLMYYGYDLSEAKAQLNSLIETAQGIVTANVAAPKAIENLNAAIAAAQSVEQTEDAIKAASENLSNAITTANGTVDAYASYTASLSACESIRDNSEDFEEGAKTTFSEAIESAKSAIAEAATVEAVNTVYSTLETARQVYVKKADPTNGTYFDYTFLVTNPGFDNDKEGWTSTGGAQNKAIATNKTNGIITGKFYENWNGSAFTGEIYQTVSNLPSGIYKLKIAAFGAGTNVYANDKQTAVTTSDGAWYEVDQVKVGDGTLKFGVKNENATTWMGIDNASLEYYGFDVPTAQSAITSMVTEAEGLVGKPMNADVASALQAAIDDADATKTTRNELNSMIDALNTAIASAKTSIAEYEKIATYIAKANTIDESIAASYKSEYDNRTLSGPAAEVFKALELATYTYVKDEFSYPVELEANGWIPEGPTAPMSGQHFDGTNSSSYLEQSSAAWGWDAWSISYKHDKTLPAGDYVFKVAGRRASGIGNTMSLVVTNINDPDNVVELGLVNDFPEGDTGLGINTKGETSFDANDEAGFANNGAGRGWQWRYVKFTLSSETTVRIAVTAEATTKYQWVGFCNATLQMTEETYLAANMSALDAPRAAAEALVDTKPMGTAENTALQAALDMRVTTGAELQAKINALNTAVANANAWIPKYNAAKAPLVAALERFEADYNDAENGALDYMCKSRWATAISMAQAAAVAKDVTDRYDGFATATENLVAALDAATVSVGEYAKLKTSIDEATPYLDGNDWGNEPFQKPESAKDDFNAIKTTAQNAYDAAEVDGEGVTAVIESLSTAVNDVVLNAPAEGQRFYIKVATEGHDKKGNAILATLGATSNNNPTGYGLNTDSVAKGYLAQAFIFTQVEENLYNISIERPEGTVYLTYGSLNGSAAGWKKQQIQATTVAENKGQFKIVPTGQNGILKIFNTVDNNYIDCQAGGAIYTDTGISNEEFAFELATETEVTLTLSKVGWGTLILPFNAEIPEGVTVYGSDMIEGDLLKLSEAESIVANTPYLVNGTEGTYNFSGYGLAETGSYADANGFVGTYVDHKTTEGEYVLQNQKGKVAFYCVGESVKPTVKAYRCYLTASANEAKAFFFGDEVTGINGVDAADTEIEAIYTINGTRVNNLQKGLNIVKMSNGKTQKVYVK